MAAREKAFQSGKFKKVLRTLLKRHTGSGPLRRVVSEDGISHTDPEAVIQHTSQYFRGVFEGSGHTPWYEEDHVPAGVRMFFEDSKSGWEERERCLRGDWHEDWLRLPPHLRAMQRMFSFKGNGLVEEMEKHFGDLLRPISQAEWASYWSGKSRTTSAGPSGVRPDYFRALDDEQMNLWRRFYNSLLATGVIPRQWRKSWIVAIEKTPGVTVLNKLRPIRLQELGPKCVCAIIKTRIKSILEALGLLHPAQFGFRAERSCALAVMNIVAATQDAWRYRKELHVCALDLRKAFDSCSKTLVAAAMRRLGIPLRAVEFLMEIDRRSEITVRTFWDCFVPGAVDSFHASFGVAQGSSHAPLSFIILLDVCLTELERRGVSKAICMDIAAACSASSGLSAFADDTTLLASSREELQSAISHLVEVFALVLLRLAPEKSQHMALKFDPISGGTLLGEDMITSRVEAGGTVIPFVEADEGIRILGYWIDLHLDWGNMKAKLLGTIHKFSSAVKPARVSRELLLYAVETVLMKQLLYPLAVGSLSLEDLRELEWEILSWLLPKLGLHRTYSRHLLSASTELGGLGWTSLATRVALEKAKLAMDMISHPDGGVRTTYISMRNAFYDESSSGRIILGGHRTDEERYWESGTEEGAPSGQCQKSWIADFDSLLSHLHVQWDDGWRPAPLREGDILLLEAMNRALSEEAISWDEACAVRTGLIQGDVRWLSQLALGDGFTVPPIYRAQGWEWTHTLFHKILNLLPLANDYCSFPRALGAWNNERIRGQAGMIQTVWGEGIRLGAVVTTRDDSDSFGIVRELSGGDQAPVVKVEWLDHSGCGCETQMPNLPKSPWRYATSGACSFRRLEYGKLSYSRFHWHSCLVPDQSGRTSVDWSIVDQSSGRSRGDTAQQRSRYPSLHPGQTTLKTH